MNSSQKFKKLYTLMTKTFISLRTTSQVCALRHAECHLFIIKELYTRNLTLIKSRGTTIIKLNNNTIKSIFDGTFNFPHQLDEGL